MVKLEESKGKLGESLIFGNAQLGSLLSRVQSAVIRSGIELETKIWEEIPENLRTSLNELSKESYEPNEKPPIQVVFKPSKPDPDRPSKSVQADFLIVDNQNRRFTLVEVKEGYVFDTKKSDGELTSLKSITSWLAQEFAFRTSYYICAFNQKSKEEIVKGTKNRFSIEHVLTGREFCEKIGIDYDTFREKRKVDQVVNRAYFLKTLLDIPEIRAEILQILNLDSE